MLLSCPTRWSPSCETIERIQFAHEPIGWGYVIRIEHDCQRCIGCTFFWMRAVTVMRLSLSANSAVWGTSMTWSVDRAIEWSWLISCWLSVNVDEMCAQRSRREQKQVPDRILDGARRALLIDFILSREYLSPSPLVSLSLNKSRGTRCQSDNPNLFPNHHLFPAFTSEFPSFPHNAPQHRDALLNIHKVSPAHGKYAKTRVLRRGSGCRVFV